MSQKRVAPGVSVGVSDGSSCGLSTTGQCIGLRERRQSLWKPRPPLTGDDGTVRIPLSHGLVTVVDGVDAELASLRWHAQWKKNGKDHYAIRRSPRANGKGQGCVALHRAVLERKLGRPLAPGEQADHINHDTLDNRRVNLRACTVKQNAFNRRVSTRTQIGFKGVMFCARLELWYAQIAIGSKGVKLGHFHSVHEAAAAYDLAALRFHGEFACTNFPESAYPTMENARKLASQLAAGTLTTAEVDAAARAFVEGEVR
jgi:hypothetical protein